jgi:hypothetical protein
VPASTSRLEWLARLAPPLALAALYARTAGYPLIWDDLAFSAQAVYARCDLRAILLSPANGIEYLPVRDLTLCFDHAVFGDWGGGFHATNVVLFMWASVWIHGLYRLLFAASPSPRLSGRAPLLALVAVALLVVHPLQVEPVAFVTGRNALLAQLFLVGSLSSYGHWLLSGGPRWLYAASILLVPLAVLSKATAAPLPLLLLLLHLYLRRDDGLLRALARVAPHLALAIPLGLLHLEVASQAALHAKISLARVLSQLPMAGFVPNFYLYKFLWPFDLSVEYVIHGLRKDMPELAVLTLVMLAGGAVFALVRRKTRSLGVFLGAAYLVALAPVLNLFPTVPQVADRYAQIPILFLAPLVAALLARLPARAAAALAATAIAALALLSHWQIDLWKSEDRLFAHAARLHPRAGLSLERLGYALWKQGREAEAIDAFRRLAELDPREERHLLYGGLSAFRRGDVEAADALMARVEGKRPLNHLLYVILGDYYANRGDVASAIGYYERARADARQVAHREANAKMILETTGPKLARLRTLEGAGAQPGSPGP